MTEARIQNEIRNALAGRALIFRANVGQAWAGTVVEKTSRRIVLEDYRPFSTGLPSGFSDLFGLVPTLITPADVGEQRAIFTAIECKAPNGRPSRLQENFLAAVAANGGRSGIARSIAEALQIVEGAR